VKVIWIVLILVAVVFVLLGIVWMRQPANSLVEHLTPEELSRLRLEDQQKQCNTLITVYHPALDATFEVEMRSGDFHDEWHRAVEEIGANIRTTTGLLKDPTDAVDSVLSALEHKGNPQSDYVLLGAAMPLEARRQFEAFCINAEVR